MRPDHATLLRWLREEAPARLERLRAVAERCAHQRLGARVHLRALIEISTYCRRDCAYCGLRRSNRAVPRLRLTDHAIVAAAAHAARWGIDTVVLQGGEDDGLDAEWLARLIAQIKRESSLFVTLSLGERSDDELVLWRRAGADRYLLRFETSDPTLFRRIHPPARARGVVGGPGRDRVALVRRLRELGYETGTGFMVGIPGQSDVSMAEDLLLLADLQPDMIGIGPFVPHPDTPLGRHRAFAAASGASIENVPTKTGRPMPASSEMCARVVSLARLLCPRANMPATTALATSDRQDGAGRGLRAGANVLMPDFTPPPLRSAYQIYPNKAGADEETDACVRRAIARSHALGLAVC